MTLSVFIPLTKADIAKREVWGVAAIEQPDQAREIMDYKKSKPHFLKWSDSIHKASNGKSLGNVREGHTTHAVGKVIALEADDAAKAIRVGIKVVDDNAWEKVLEGVFTGFSIGGAYGERWEDSVQKGFTRYEAKPTELSLVDVPCIPGATFDVVKADGSVMTKAFPSQEEDPKEETTPADKVPVGEGDNSSDQSAAPADNDQNEEPMNSEDEASAADSAEDTAEGEMEAEAQPTAMNVEAVKQVVIQLLLKLGLVQEQGGAMMMSAKISNMAKAADQQSILSKDLGDFKSQIVGDLAKIAVAIDGLEKRGSGPVLREVGPITPQMQADTQRADLLKKMASETSDPNVKQSLLNEAARLEIKKIQNT